MPESTLRLVGGTECAPPASPYTAISAAIDLMEASITLLRTHLADAQAVR